MDIEQEIFKNNTVIIDKLEAYGFVKIKDTYQYSKLILNDTFKVVITITPPTNVKCKIYDLAFNEEYINYKIKNQTGEFTNNIKNILEEILIDIKNKCFDTKETQAIRITNSIIKKYQDQPEYLWKKYPKDGIFRNKTTKKWYALIMNIDKNKIDIGNEKVDILNIKLKPKTIKEKLKEKGFYEAYHMNKKYWITIILDDTINDKEIMHLIDESYNNVLNK